MVRRWLKIGMVALAGSSGCASNYVYQPESHGSAEIRGHSAALYQLPPEAPSGDVRVASFGISKITPQGGAPMHALHARLVISNNSAQPWSIDTSQQLAQIRSGEKLHPGYVRTDGGNPPMIAIPAGGKRTVDLFYPLPPDREKAKQLPEFDVLWRIQTTTRLVADRTSFERLRVEPLYAGGWGYNGYGFPYGGPYGYGPYGWYDPFWGPGLIGPPGWEW